MPWPPELIKRVADAMMDNGPWWADEPVELEQRAERVLDAITPEIVGLRDAYRMARGIVRENAEAAYAARPEIPRPPPAPPMWWDALDSPQ